MSLQKPPLTLRTKRKYHQGYFIPSNPQKYIGDKTKIIYRSRFELCFLKWCDTSPFVLRYSSEECVIPYISPIDGKQHRYYMDFFVSILQEDNTVKSFLVEIKPFSQTIPPKPTKKHPVNSEAYNEAMKTYLVNQAKWKQADKVCKKRGWEFKLITENELFKSRK